MMRKLAQRTVLSLSLSCSVLFSSATAAAECQSRVEDLLRAAYPGASIETGDEGELLRVERPQKRWIQPAEVVCKVWPAAPDKTLLAVPLRHEAAKGPDGDVSDLELLVADSKRPRILQRLREDEALRSDAIYITGLTLDTARYRLDERTTAFGVRVEYTGSSRPNPYGSTTLSLYVPEGASLRRVLDPIEVSSSRGEWDTNCAGEFSETQRTLAMDTKRDNGYAGLMVNSVHQERRNVEQGGDCKSVDSPVSKTQQRLRYDGRRYPLTKELRGVE